MTAATTTTGPSAQPDEAARRCLRSDLEWLRSQLVAAIEEKPLTAAATAAAIGFMLGGGMTRPALGLLIQTGSRLAASRLDAALQAQGRGDDGPTDEVRA